MSEEKIKVPAAWAAQRDEEAQRRELVGQWREHLATGQRKVLDEEGPYGNFRSRLPVEVLKNLTPNEREELMAHEEAEFNRLKPLARAKDEQRRAHVMAGGSAEAFERQWADYGEAITIDARAAESLDRAARSSSPY
jgi:hypothetical protein